MAIKRGEEEMKIKSVGNMRKYAKYLRERKKLTPEQRYFGKDRFKKLSKKYWLNVKRIKDDGSTRYEVEPVSYNNLKDARERQKDLSLYSGRVLDVKIMREVKKR